MLNSKKLTLLAIKITCGNLAGGSGHITGRKRNFWNKKREQIHCMK